MKRFLLIAAVLTGLAMASSPAMAQWGRRGYYRPYYGAPVYGGPAYYRGYYRAPVYYGPPAYVAPPVYAPGVGVGVGVAPGIGVGVGVAPGVGAGVGVY